MINKLESGVEKGNELGEIEQMPPEFELSFKFFINQFPTSRTVYSGSWYSVFHATNSNWNACTESNAGVFMWFLIRSNNVTD